MARKRQRCCYLLRGKKRQQLFRDRDTSESLYSHERRIFFFSDRITLECIQQSLLSLFSRRRRRWTKRLLLLVAEWWIAACPVVVPAQRRGKKKTKNVFSPFWYWSRTRFAFDKRIVLYLIYLLSLRHGRWRPSNGRLIKIEIFFAWKSTL